VSSKFRKTFEYQSIGFFLCSQPLKLGNTDKLIFPINTNIASFKKYKDFSACYKSKKQECEDDWDCNLACSFNPCAISYAAGCLIEGASGNIDSWNLKNII